MIDIDLKEYDYNLHEENIAQYPAEERDKSKLLYYNAGIISQDTFKNIISYIPSGSTLVFNNTTVIKARLLFKKSTGADIEILCIEPLLPATYENALMAGSPVEWKCIVGNLKKWKNGTIISIFDYGGKEVVLTAERMRSEGEAWRVRFRWNAPELCFGELIAISGHIPLPPYINRTDEEIDYLRYQTVYSSVMGSVAAPTAGLHFTSDIIRKLGEKGIIKAELTLHVGAGTFQPVKSDMITNHQMHCEHFFVSDKTLEMLIENEGRIIAVGTTSVRTLESLYWLGIQAIKHPTLLCNPLTISQWEPYSIETNISSKQSLQALLTFLRRSKKTNVKASTSIMIVPGYEFRIINGMITNFHQPRSTLLLLISAWVGKDWQKIYKFALENNFKFLSYGDSSLLFR